MRQLDRKNRGGARRRPGAVGFAVAALAAVLVAVQSGATTLHAASGPMWWKVDLHEHSAFSGDARSDIGIDAAKAKAQNYNAIFLTDHDRGSGFQISGDNGNKVSVPEQLNTNWTSKVVIAANPPPGNSATPPTAVQSPVHSGTYAIHIAATSGNSSTVRSMAYNPRGTGLRSGTIMLDFWAYPVSTGASSGLDVSVALGGDSTAGPTPFGYTTSDGTPHIGKTTVLVWQLGGARASAQNGTNDVFSNGLSFTANTWNHYVINITTGQVQWTPQGGSTTTTSSTGLNGLPGSDAPADYDVLSYVKMEAVAKSGSADGYFDDFFLNVASPQCTSTEFVYRNSLLSGLAGTNNGGGQFVVFPAREMGQNNHTNQFNFGITDTSQYKDTFTDSVQDDNAICAAVNNPSAQWQFSKLGTDNITAVQASGYPVQNNHPGVSGFSVGDVVNSNAYGADAVEARTGVDYSNPSEIPSGDAWDQILMHNVVIMGTQGSDAHEGVGPTTPSMYIDAPSLTLNDLMHSYFEGRMYGAPGNFGGTVVFNLDGSPSPYPARYPVYVPSSQTSANVNLAISGGIGSSQQVHWIYSSGGAIPTVQSVDPSGSSYSSPFTVPLSGAFTYVRAAVITPGATVPTAVNTEPILFESVTGMPAGMSAHVDSITPPTGACSCTKALTKGITGTTYSNSTLTLALNDPVGSGVQLLVQSPQTPDTVRVDGSAVSAAASLADYQSGTGTSWFYDSGSSTLYLRDLHAITSSTIAVDYSGGGGDVTPPSVPTGVNGTPVGTTEIDLSWTASTDNAGGSGVAGYNVYRGGSKVNLALVTSTNYQDLGLTPGTQYSYTISAVDNQGNESAQSSPPKLVTTGSGGGGGTFNAIADSYVDGSAPSSNFGSNVKLRVDTSPTVNSYLRFNVSGVSGSVTSVAFKIFATSALSAGFEVHALANDSWVESTITSSNAPAAGSLLATSPAVVANTWVTVNLPAGAVTGNGDVNLVLIGRSSTALAMASRETATPPQLIVTSSGGGGGGDTTPPSVPTGVNGTPVGSSEIDLSWTGSTDNAGGSGVAGYNVYRDGSKVNSSLVTTTNYADTGLSASTQYSYTVSAVDNQANESAQSSPPKQVTTGSGGGGGGGTFTPIADSYVDASVPSTNFGSNVKLRVDTSPIVNSYLRFDVSGVSGSVTSVTLQIYATSALSAGFEVHALADDTWVESTIMSANAPAAGVLLATSPAAVANSYVTVTLPLNAVTGNGHLDFVLVGRSTTALALASRESATPPQLVITTS